MCGDAAAPPAERPTKPTTTAEKLLELPVLVAPVPHAEQPVALRNRQEESVVARGTRADAPKFETFVAEGWQPWLGVSS